MKVRKANKILTISEENKKTFLARGYDVINDKGEVVERNTKAVTLAEYQALKAENEALKAEIAKLKKKV